MDDFDSYDNDYAGGETQPAHSQQECKGRACPFHSPSDHHMRDWPMVVRYDRKALTERVCQHGVGHPDPDALAWLASYGYDESIHGCDGCCGLRPPRKGEEDA